MLDNFFKLNGPTTAEIQTQEEFEKLLEVSRDLRNAKYMSDNLQPTGERPKMKIKEHVFTNFSFSKTVIQNIVFINCRFVDCLFIGTTIIDCEFHNCKFKNVNTFKISIDNTYVNPESFANSIKGINNSNIAVHLYQQLLSNSKKQGQQEFSRIAEYNFNKWKDRLSLNKFWNGKPYKINLYQFIKEYPLNFLFKWTFGYGLRFKNFVITFIVCFVGFFFINKHNWVSYSLSSKDITIDAFNPDSATFTSNIIYTLDATTKLIDSQFQPKSDIGMFWLCFQSFVAFILFSALITILINRFVK